MMRLVEVSLFEARAFFVRARMMIIFEFWMAIEL